MIKNREQDFESRFEARVKLSCMGGGGGGKGSQPTVAAAPAAPPTPAPPITPTYAEPANSNDMAQQTTVANQAGKRSLRIDLSPGTGAVGGSTSNASGLNIPV